MSLLSCAWATVVLRFCQLNAMVAQSGQVGEHVGNVPQSVRHQQVEAGQRRLHPAWLSQVLQTVGEPDPRLGGA